MPRTETCTMCSGSGVTVLGHTCAACSGNGYMLAAEPTIHDALKTLREAETQDPEPNYLGVPDLDAQGEELRRTFEDQVLGKADAKPVPGRMANQTWRILEEQRMAAEETIAECEAEIERWSDKMVDAIKAKRICEAGQAALEGEA